MADPEIEAIKDQLVEVDKEINAIKAAVRLLGSQSEDDKHPNSVTVIALKVQGLPEEAKPKLTLQLSSPIEEATLTEMFDPLIEEEKIPDTMKATFQNVQTGQATLSVTAADADIPLGGSEPLDLAPVTKFDAMYSKTEYESVVDIPIRPEGVAGANVEPTCTISLRVTFVPGNAEKREQLYELLGAKTKEKSVIVEKLRHASMRAATRTPSSATSGPAVKSGFLNKGAGAAAAPKKEASRLQEWYERYLGPQSLLRRSFPVVKNYVLFFGMVGFFHFKGHLLALPPPV